MNNQEAKFILAGYRPDGRDANDAQFAAAIAQAERDPELRAWWERQREFDTSMVAKLKEVAPPAGLRDSILAGVRASQPRRYWWNSFPLLATAAAIAILVTALALRTPPAGPSGQEFASFALNDVADAHDQHIGDPARLREVQTRLINAAVPFSSALKVDLDELRKKNCRTVQLAGREVFEICFQHNGTWFHLYAGKRDDFAPGNIDPKSTITSRGEFASTVWADGKILYALVTSAGAEALRRLI